MGGATVRVWGRWWRGLCAAMFVVAVSGPAGAAAAGSAPANASADAVSVFAPGADPAGTGLASAGGPAVKSGPYADGATVFTTWARADAARETGAPRSATAGSILRHVRLLHGAVRARKVWTSIALGVEKGAVSDTTASGVQGLFVLGRRVHARPGMQVHLHGWATLDILPGGRTTTGRTVTEDVAGLKLTLLHHHDGLPAGTTITLGAASASLTLPPPAAPPPKSHKPKPKPTPTPTPKPRPAKHHHAPAAPRPTPKGHRPATVHIPHAAHALITAAAGGRARVIKAGLEQVGWPYIWGGDSHSEGGFDCSGLVDYAYARAGMALPGRPTAAVLWRMSAGVDRRHLQPGDLAFLYTRTRAPYHVALYVGAGLVVVAPHSGANVQIERLSAVPWDGYGRLLRGGLGNGLARSVALAARRFAHPAPLWLVASPASDAISDRGVQSAGEAFDGRLFLSHAPAPAPAVEAAPQLVPMASVHEPAGPGDTGIAGLVLILLVGAAACVVRVPALTRGPKGD
jgi:cell wall-associated NlpC family hydrolase